MEVAVIVPARDAAATLPACLAALEAQQGAPRFEVVVVDNGSTDGTRALVGPQHRLVEEPTPGSYAARNAGIAATDAPVLAFTDADCVPDPGWVAAGAAALARVPLAGGAVEPLLPAAPNLWEVYDAATYLDQRRYVAEEGFAATANLFVRRAVFEAVGPFDAGLRSSGDWEFCRRAGAAGFAIAFAEDAVVRHRPRDTLASTWRLHRRLGAGWRHVAGRPRVLADPAMRWQLAAVVEAVSSRPTLPHVRRRRLAVAHAVAVGARWFGRCVTMER